MRAVQVRLPGRWLYPFLLGLLVHGVSPIAAESPASVGVADHDGMGLHLVDGRQVRLAGIHTPSSSDGADDSAARRALDALVGAAPVTLPPAPWPLDRHGRMRVQVHAADGAWLQGELVRRGLALVAPAPDVPAPVLTALLGLERTARLARAGMWAGGDAGPWPAERVAVPRGRYLLVRGRVRAVARAQDQVYLNFGEDWRSDFTIRVDARRAGRFGKDGLDLDTLTGRLVEIRGLLFETNGPMIDLIDPAQLEPLE